jgi:hypothetical protein
MGMRRERYAGRQTLPRAISWPREDRLDGPGRSSRRQVRRQCSDGSGLLQRLPDLRDDEHRRSCHGGHRRRWLRGRELCAATLDQVGDRLNVSTRSAGGVRVDRLRPAQRRFQRRLAGLERSSRTFPYKGALDDFRLFLAAIVPIGVERPSGRGRLPAVVANETRELERERTQQVQRERWKRRVADVGVFELSVIDEGLPD